MIVFDVDNVTKVYPRQSVPANKDISLQIHRGEIFGLPGGNAGKTTLVRRMVALLPPRPADIGWSCDHPAGPGRLCYATEHDRIPMVGWEEDDLARRIIHKESAMTARDIVAEIEEIVNRETRAWDTQDVDLLMTLFHPDMVWPWPPTAQDHDPLDWVLEWGRYDETRWRAGWQSLFDTHKLIHNVRRLRKIVVSEQGDGAFAVVDVDTLWQDNTGREQHWKGRAGKTYTRVGDAWKLIAHTGLLEY